MSERIDNIKSEKNKEEDNIPLYTTQDPTIMVTNTNDSGPGSLQDAINIATPGDTIVFDVAIQNATITLTSPIDINKTLTISGPGPAISGGNTIPTPTRIFDIIGAATVVTIRDLTIENGFSSGDGGAILNEGATLNVVSCTFSNNKSLGSGGAIANINGGTVNITNNSKFLDNSANSGGAIGNFGSSTVNITNSMFSGNKALGGNGGAIANDGTANITRGTFTMNNASDKGGAIASDGTATIVNSLFQGNIAINSGGAIANLDSGLANITNSTFTNNSANFAGAIGNFPTAIVNITNSTFSNNSATSNGGAIANDGTANIKKSTFSNNSAINGGAIANDGTVTIANSLFSDNTATNSGGAIANLDSGTVTIKNSTFINNKPQDIFNAPGSTLITTNTTFSSNP